MREIERAQERVCVSETLTTRDGRLQGPPSHLQQGESKIKAAREKKKERDRERIAPKLGTTTLRLVTGSWAQIDLLRPACRVIAQFHTHG